MIVVATDFGLSGPYMGQMTAVLLQEAPGIPVLPLMADLPEFNPRASAYLLAACVCDFPVDTVFLGVVDPGVGSDRKPIVLKADGWWLVGPDNGLFSVAAQRARRVEAWAISWRPTRLSPSFHGRDLFAPVAARIARDSVVPGEPIDAGGLVGADWPADLHEIVYVDRYGNAVTGLRAREVSRVDYFEVAERKLAFRKTFAEARGVEPFWYENSVGLVEFAINGADAASALGLQIGSGFSRVTSGV